MPADRPCHAWRQDPVPRHDNAPSGRVLVDVVVAAVPRLPTFALTPRGDFAPVRFEDRSRPVALSRYVNTLQAEQAWRMPTSDAYPPYEAEWLNICISVLYCVQIHTGHYDA
jgi:hypothetical protein